MSLQITTIKLPSAEFGEINPSVDINNINYIHAGYAVSESCKQHLPENFGKGMIKTMLPYMQQDDYSRSLKEREHKVAILENKFLKATFLLDLGGRLYSLVDKTCGRELLYKNKVFRVANLSLRNAWFSGGIEWNVSIKGHNPLTCSPMFAQKLTFEGGDAGLRLFEYERIRKIVYSIDFRLPPESKFLFVNPRIENTENEEKFTYWWSNIAVKEERDLRIIVPAHHSYISSYNKNNYFVDYGTIPEYEGIDVTYPQNKDCSNDYFYDLDEDTDKWIACVNGEGNGLVQVSTRELKGRKLFVWGHSAGGRNWNEFLSLKGDAYVEIQAGLCETQMQHLTMAGSSIIDWVEAYGSLSVPAQSAHGDYEGAIASVAGFINSSFQGGADSFLRSMFVKEPVLGQIINYGSGWGALRQKQLAMQSKPSLSNYVVFPEQSLGNEQRFFSQLLDGLALDIPDVCDAPLSYMNDSYYLELIENKIKESGGDRWYLYLQAGVIYHWLNDTDNALKCWENSRNEHNNCWAVRNLAMLYRNIFCDSGKAVALMLEAVQLGGERRYLLIDLAETLIKAELYESWVSVYENLSDRMKQIGRLTYYYAYCLEKLGFAERAATVINDEFVMNDIKEGEFSVTELWYKIYGRILINNGEISASSPEKEIRKLVEKKYPLDKVDFRMHAQSGG